LKKTLAKIKGFVRNQQPFIALSLFALNKIRTTPLLTVEEV
jgi:hypothetical protein